jgi:hypothetical protein
MKPLRVMSLLVVLLTAACAGGSPTPQLAAPSAVPTQPALPTEQASEVPPQPSATDVTPLGATSPSVLAAAPPAPNAAAAVTRIRFQTGATSASLTGTLAAGGKHSYVLGAMAGQTMTVKLTYPSGEAWLVIWGADGEVLISDHAGAKQWSGPLPKTQDYYIDVRAAADSSTVNYTLQVIIPPSGSGGEPQATRIKFPSGGTSATVQGSVPPGGVKRYVLGAMAGQTMTVRLTPDNAQAYVVIWGADGTVLLSGAGEGKKWSGPLPRTQDYYIDVKSSGSATVSYSLSVGIPPK